MRWQERRAQKICRRLPLFGLYYHDFNVEHGRIAIRISRLSEFDPEGVIVFSSKMKVEDREIAAKAREAIEVLRKWDIYATAEVQIR